MSFFLTQRYIIIKTCEFQQLYKASLLVAIINYSIFHRLHFRSNDKISLCIFFIYFTLCFYGISGRDA